MHPVAIASSGEHYAHTRGGREIATIGLTVTLDLELEPVSSIHSLEVLHGTIIYRVGHSLQQQHRGARSNPEQATLVVVGDGRLKRLAGMVWAQTVAVLQRSVVRVRREVLVF